MVCLQWLVGIDFLLFVQGWIIFFLTCGLSITKFHAQGFEVWPCNECHIIMNIKHVMNVITCVSGKLHNDVFHLLLIVQIFIKHYQMLNSWQFSCKCKVVYTKQILGRNQWNDSVFWTKSWTSGWDYLPVQHYQELMQVSRTEDLVFLVEITSKLNEL